jgi:hypothetical protein
LTVFSVLILSSAIGVGASREPASEKKDAFKALSKATYLYTNTDKYVKNIEKKYIPSNIKKYGGTVAGISKAVFDKKISFEWTF